MAWAALTVTDLKERASDEEIEALELAGETDATDNAKIQGCLDQAASLARGFIGNCDRNLPMPTGLSIPDECKWAVLTIARHFISATVPNFSSAQGEARATEYADAMRFLREDVGGCKVAIVSDGATEGAPAQPGLCYGSKTKLDFSL